MLEETLKSHNQKFIYHSGADNKNHPNWCDQNYFINLAFFLTSERRTMKQIVHIFSLSLQANSVTTLEV